MARTLSESAAASSREEPRSAPLLPEPAAQPEPAPSKPAQSELSAPASHGGAALVESAEELSPESTSKPAIATEGSLAATQSAPDPATAKLARLKELTHQLA
eukprot:5164156-Karenia_brevis.AAC.1